MTIVTLWTSDKPSRRYAKWGDDIVQTMRIILYAQPVDDPVRSQSHAVRKSLPTSRSFTGIHYLVWLCWLCFFFRYWAKLSSGAGGGRSC